MNQTNPVPALIGSILPLLIMLIPVIIAVNKLAKEKGKNVALWTFLACIPLINIVSIIYIVGATNSKLEEKIDRILAQMNSETK